MTRTQKADRNDTFLVPAVTDSRNLKRSNAHTSAAFNAGIRGNTNHRSGAVANHESGHSQAIKQAKKDFGGFQVLGISVCQGFQVQCPSPLSSTEARPIGPKTAPPQEPGFLLRNVT